MDISDKDKFELEKRSGDSLNYHSASMSWDWRFGGANLTNTSMSMVQGSNPMAVCKGDLVGSSSCSSASVVDSYGPNLWDHPANSQTLGFCDMNVQNNASTSSTLGIRKVGPGSLRMDIDKTLDIGWNPPSSMLKGGIFLPNAPGMLPQSMSQFPADSAFIERAARSSCFNGGDFSDMMNPFSISESLNPYSRGGGMLQQDVFANNGLKSVPGGQSQKDELSMAEISEDVSSAVRGAMEGSPLKNERKSERLVKSIDEAKQGIGVSGNESDEAEFSGGGGGQEEPSILEGTGGEPSSSKGLGSKKKKRSGQDTEIDQVKGGPPQPGEASKDDTEIQHKGDQNPSSVPSKNTGKHGKQGAQASDPPKEEYTHVRARRAGLTNNHSLAERVRREKISERMKFLQDLVPGCNKITGKALMLDEIINYVQSLQRQVEIMVQGSNPMAVCKGDLVGSSSCSSASVVDSYGPNLWDHPANSQTLGFCDMNVQNNASTSSTLGIRKVGPGSLRMDIDKTLDIGWNPPSSMLKGGIFLPNAPGMLPQSMSQFPADSAFIERAARSSCFNGGDFSDMMNPFSISESLNPYSRGGGMLQQDVFANNGLKSVPGGQSQKDELSMAEISEDVSSAVRGAMEGSPLKNERKSERLVKSIDEAKQGIGVSGNESDEAEFSGGGGGQEEPSILEGTGGEPSSSKGLGSKKKKRSGQDTEIDQVKGGPPQPGEASKDNTEIQHKGDQKLISVPSKNTGKHGKQGAQASDPPKEEYIHVRARRGGATNSHSLAERERRKKISERMKIIQDLVPGCNKITGKALMLDEIINYVQSLQRQVEFLSMKLATVNPRLDFNIEGILGKDILQPRVGPSTMGFSSETTMPYPQLHPSQPGSIQVGLPGLGNSSDAIQGTSNSQLTAMSGGYMESTSQWYIILPQGVMRQNIEMVMDRGEKIEVLVGKAEDLQKEANYYQENGWAIQRKMWYQNMKIKLIFIGVLILILVLIIWSSVCGLRWIQLQQLVSCYC